MSKEVKFGLHLKIIIGLESCVILLHICFKIIILLQLVFVLVYVMEPGSFTRRLINFIEITEFHTSEFHPISD